MMTMRTIAWFVLVLLTALPARVPAGELSIIERGDQTLVVVLSDGAVEPKLYRLYFACVSSKDGFVALADAPAGCPKGTGANPVLTSPGSLDALKKSGPEAGKLPPTHSERPHTA